jgi:Tol biopolymer transport system component/DNA-binding winged helix-turn-helix (wHTH) protein
VEEAVQSNRIVRFGTFEADLQAGELRKSGVRLKLTGQPFQVLAILLECPGKLVTREELQKRLWPDTFVDVDHNLNTAINKIREALGDTVENPRFVETRPRRGYRFIARVEGAAKTAEVQNGSLQPSHRTRTLHFLVVLGACLLLAGAGLFIYRNWQAHRAPLQRSLTRLTFDDGLQIGSTWSPDGRFIAYSSDRGGKFDVWVQQVSGGDPVQITMRPGHNWQPDWSPDGKYITYRSEEGDGGLFVIPALGGTGLERKIASFGYYPRWSPDGSQILFRTTQYLGLNRFFVVTPDGSQPHEVLTQFPPREERSAWSAAWHPDGKRVTAWVWGEEGNSFWTVPLAGGVPVKSEFSPEVAKELEEVALRGIVEWTKDTSFSWAPSGRAIYCALTFRGARNLWKMTVDPTTLRVTAIERLTTGPGPDGGLTLSPDGRRLAFTSESEQIRAWLYPFDASRGRLTGAGQAVSPAGMATWRHDLSRDGSKLAFASIHAGRFELWEKSLLNTRMAPIVVDDYLRDFPHWSPDGKHLVYERSKLLTHEHQFVLWSAESRNEEPIGDVAMAGIDGWSLDGNALLVSQRNNTTNHAEILLLPIAAAPKGEARARKLISDPNLDLYQAQFSADGKWIVFEAVKDLPNGLESTLYVTSASGGSWTSVTDGKHWDDKPRWSPDGKAIYFISGRSGFFNVWGVHFDRALGKSVGKPFAVTSFDSPALMVPQHVPSVELSLNQNRLALTVEQVSGSLWVLDHVDQ